MIQNKQHTVTLQMVEQAMRDELTAGDTVLASTRPILRHLLANRDQSLFSDEVIARVRGMVGHIAHQLVQACADAAGQGDSVGDDPAAADDLTGHLLSDAAFLGHAHALTLEAIMVDHLQRRSGIDGVLVPLLQELAAASDPTLSEAAMKLIAAQARFLQQTRRMELPLGELPGDLFHKALVMMRQLQPADHPRQLVEDRLRGEFNEAQSRLGQLSRFVMALGGRANRALAIDNAGLAIFSTALAMASGQDRGLVVLSFGENQMARLALSLRAAGLGQAAVEEQFLYLHPDALLPDGFDWITTDKAAGLLAVSALEAAG
jgi:hypothetical protein